MNYNNVIGFLISIIFVIQFISGMLLSCYYSDHHKIAFESIIYIITDVNIGWFIRLIHIVGVSLFMLFIIFHLMRGIWIKLRIIYLDSAINVIWVSGLILICLSLVEGFIGYILLWGQMSYWGITVILNILSIIPYFGILIIDLIWCSSQVIVYRIFIFHFIIGLMIGILIISHIFIIHSLLIYFNKIYYNDTFIELVCTLFSLLFLLFIISPALIILLDIDSIIIPSFIIYSLGYH